MNTFTTKTLAINYLSNLLSLSIDGAQWVYENTDCQAWDAEKFSDYDFLSDAKINAIPETLVN